jgi:transposase InsO family protein
MSSQNFAVNDKGDLILKRNPTGAGDVKAARPKPTTWNKDDLTEQSERSLNKIRWTPARIKELQKEYTGLKQEKDGHWYLGERRIVLQGEDIEPILEEEYRQLAPSIGYLRMYSILQQAYIGLKRDRVKAWLDRQELKQKYRELRKRSQSRATIPTGPSKRWQLDYGSLGNTDGWWRNQKWSKFAVFWDSYSKYVYLKPLKGETGEEAVALIDAWLEHLAEIGAPRPRTLGTDNGSAFISAEFEEHLKEKGLTHVRAKSWTPGSQGGAEISVRNVKRYLQSLVDAEGRPSSWPQFLGRIQAIINASWTRTLKTGRTPYETLTGERDPKLAERLKEQALNRRNSKLYIKNALEPGQPVRLSVRITGDSSTKGALKAGTRKGYLQNYDVSRVYIVDQKRGNSYRLKTTDGEIVRELFDRADLLKVPSTESKNAYRREEEEAAPQEEERPAPTIRVRVRKEPKPKPAYTGPHADLIDKEFQEKPNGWRFRVLRIREKGGDFVADYRRVLKDGSLSGRTVYSTIPEVRGWISNTI